MSKISLKTHDVEVSLEGDDNFILANMDQTIEKCLDMSQKLSNLGDRTNSDARDYVPQSVSASKPSQVLQKVNKKSAKKAKQHGQPTLLVDLNLRPKDKQSLQEFYAEKAPASAQETTTVFVYYLQNILGIEEITLGHIYTCYKEVKIPVPTRLDQNIIDTSNRKGLITKASSVGGIKMTVTGENFVEYDLPRAKKE